MNNFNLQTIITKYKLDESSLAKELFPKNKFAKNALRRVLSGISYLDTWQLCKLSEIACIEISELFTDSNSWYRVSSDNVIKFNRNNYRVELNVETKITEIFVSDKLVAVETLISDKNIKLSEYLKLVDETIINLI
jgi:hypothetical protein